MFAHVHASCSHLPAPPPWSCKLVKALGLVEPGKEKQGMSAIVVFLLYNTGL